MISGIVDGQFVSRLKAEASLGLMLFMALITFAALSRGSNWIKGPERQGLLRESGQGCSPVLPKTVPAALVRVIRSTVTAQKSQDDYKMCREQARSVRDLWTMYPGR